MRKKLVVMLFSLIIIQQTIFMVFAQPNNRFPWRPRFNESDPETLKRFEKQIERYITFRIILSSLNMVLYGYILYLYTQLYRETSSKFTLGLTLLSGALLVYSLTSNPMVLQLFRGSEPIWIGIFNFIPDIFASVAAFIMIYLTRT
jgi:hypothetical protein